VFNIQNLISIFNKPLISDKEKIEQLVDKIFIQSNLIIDKNKDKDTKTPLIISLGKNHEASSHCIINMLLLKKFKEEGFNISFAKEESHDLVFYMLQNILDRKNYYLGKITPQIFNMMEEYDLVGGDSLLETSIGKSFYEEANQSRRILMNYVLKEKIPYISNDASTNNNECLNLDDLITHDAAKILYPKSYSSYMNAKYIDSMHVRNHIMANKTQEHINKNKPEIHIQSLGQKHNVGEGKCSYANSYVNIVKSLGFQVLAVNLDSDHEFILSDDFNLSDNEFISGIDIPNKEFNYGEYDEQKAKDEHDYIRTLVNDKDWDRYMSDINSIAAYYNDDISNKMDELANRITKEIPMVIPKRQGVMAQSLSF